MADGNIHYGSHSYLGDTEEHWRVYGNEGQMIDMNHDMGAPGANANLQEDIQLEAFEEAEAEEED